MEAVQGDGPQGREKPCSAGGDDIVSGAQQQQSVVTYVVSQHSVIAVHCATKGEVEAVTGFATANGFTTPGAGARSPRVPLQRKNPSQRRSAVGLNQGPATRRPHIKKRNRVMETLSTLNVPLLISLLSEPFGPEALEKLLQQNPGGVTRLPVGLAFLHVRLRRRRLDLH
jgi:hypothetical protein